MGSVAAKCSDVEFAPNLGAAKPLDAEDSASEDGDEDDEDEEDEEEAEAEAEEERREAEGALNDTVAKLTRGRTTVLKEVIEHGIAVGIDEKQILKAEAKLEEHKLLRKREAYESELNDFMQGEDAMKLEAILDMIAQGEKLEVGAKVLEPLHERHKEILLSRDLEQGELKKAREFMELCARRFVGACVRGRDTIWIDLRSGKRVNVHVFLDVTLKNMKVVRSEGGVPLASAKLASLTARKGMEAEEVAELPGFTALKDSDKELSVVMLTDGDPWLFVEFNTSRTDEFLIGVVILNGLDGVTVGYKRPMEERNSSKRSSKVESPRKRRTEKKSKENEAPEDGAASPRKSKASDKKKDDKKKEDGKKENKRKTQKS